MMNKSAAIAKLALNSAFRAETLAKIKFLYKFELWKKNVNENYTAIYAVKAIYFVIAKTATYLETNYKNHL